jgi:hypothetical protein
MMCGGMMPLLSKAARTEGLATMVRVIVSALLVAGGFGVPFLGHLVLYYGQQERRPQRGVIGGQNKRIEIVAGYRSGFRIPLANLSLKYHHLSEHELHGSPGVFTRIL